MRTEFRSAKASCATAKTSGEKSVDAVRTLCLRARGAYDFSGSLPRIASMMEASSMRTSAKLFFPASLSDAPTR